jgi:hypothetical protein
MATSIRTVETREQALQRLLQVARECGTRILRDHEGMFYATSASEPDLLHPVTPDSCSCRGFMAHRRCRHIAALLDHLGHLPDPTPSLCMKISCAHVEDHYGLEADPQWHEPRTELLVDGEVKGRIVGDEEGLTVHWMEIGRPIDDLVGCAPAFLTHGGVVEYWLRRLGAPAPVDALVQASGINGHTEHRDHADEITEPIAA